MKAQTISKTKQIQSLTPQALLKQVTQKREFPKFNYNKAEDKMLLQLEDLAKRYKQTLSLDDKLSLLKHEKEMLYEEIQKPELTLARNYQQIKEMKLTKKNKKHLTDNLTLFNAIAIYRIDGLYKLFKQNLNEEDTTIIYDAVQKINTKSPIKEQLIKYFELILGRYENIFGCEEEIFDNKGSIEKLQENFNQPELLKEILTEAELNKDEKNIIKNVINKILVSENVDQTIMQYAVWGAGKYRSDEAFDKIKEIALNKDEKDIRKREFSIHSVARYLREKTDEVHAIMEKIANEENSKFADLAIIINDKINGTYYSKKDRELDYFGFDDSMKKNFKKFKAKIFNFEKPLNKKKENAIDRNLVLFDHILEFFAKSKFKFHILNDTVTKIMKKEIGKRDFHNGLYNSGSFFDSYDGICRPGKYNIMNTLEIENSYQDNPISHEMAHTLHFMLGDGFLDLMSAMYKQALKENRILHYYAASNEYEYFAHGVEAFSAIYKPHKVLLDDRNDTIFKLMAQDPDLYNLINQLTGYKYD